MTKTEIENKIDSINKIKVIGENKTAKRYQLFLANKRTYFVSLLCKMDDNNLNTITV